MRTRVVAAAAALALALTACGGSHAAPPTSPTAPTSPAHAIGASAGPAVPATGAYLGAWLNPAKAADSAPSGGAAELAQLPTFARATSRAPAILNVYSGWSAPAPVSTLRSIAAQGAIPLLAWGCTSTAAIASGQDDAQIEAYAHSLAALGTPMFLRWFWEMNLRSPGHSACLGSGGAAGFVAAWRHLRTVFARAGATNVAFVWCPGVGSAPARIASFFPGAASTDWIGADGYARAPGATVASVFGSWYATYAADDRPMLIAETGAQGADQPGYLASIAAQLPSRFPAVKALVYFDAPGPAGQWQLSAAGLTAFAQLGRSSYFAARA